MPKIHFYSAETKSRHIVAYGDVNRYRKFKITHSDGRYFAHKLINGQYQPVGEAQSLEGATELCQLSIN